MTTAEEALRELKSSRAERLGVLEQLATVDVLAHPGRPGFLREFPWDHSRDLPDERFAERGYPGAWWRAADGVSTEAVNEIFGSLLVGADG